MQQAFSGGQFAAAPLDRAELAILRRIEGHTLDHPAMPDAVRLEIPDWLLPRLAPASAQPADGAGGARAASRRSTCASTC